MPLLEAADRAEGGLGRTLSADEAVRGVCEALRKGPSRKIALLGSDAVAGDAPGECPGDGEKGRVEKERRPDVSRREFFGLFRGAFPCVDPEA